VKKSKAAGESACATKTSRLLSMVGHTVSSALTGCFFHSLLTRAAQQNRKPPSRDRKGSGLPQQAASRHLSDTALPVGQTIVLLYY
jgi:hypothetical protein